MNGLENGPGFLTDNGPLEMELADLRRKLAAAQAAPRLADFLALIPAGARFVYHAPPPVTARDRRCPDCREEF